MALSEAQVKASKKYLEKFDNVQFRVPKGERDIISDHAKSRGESMNTFIRRAIAETMERDQLKATPDK